MLRRLTVIALALATAPLLSAQTFPSTDSTIRRIWAEGMDSSQAYNLAQALMDSIGPRLTGTPGIRSGNDRLVARYQGWGVTARNVQYGTWRGWRRGVTHVDLVQPRVRTLEATMLAWSPGTRGKVQGGLVILPDVADSNALRAWLPQVKDKFVLISFPQPTCRPDSSYKQFATAESFDANKAYAKNFDGIAIENRHAGIRQNTPNVFLLARLVFVIAENSEHGNPNRRQFLS